MRSPLSLLFSRINNPSSLSCSSQDWCSRPVTSLVALLWMHLGISQLSLQPNTQKVTEAWAVSLLQYSSRKRQDTGITVTQTLHPWVLQIPAGSRDKSSQAGTLHPHRFLCSWSRHCQMCSTRPFACPCPRKLFSSRNHSSGFPPQKPQPTFIWFLIENTGLWKYEIQTF